MAAIDQRDAIFHLHRMNYEIGSAHSVCPTLQISHARRAGEPTLLNDRAMLSVGIIIEEGEIKGVAAVAAGSASLLQIEFRGGFALGTFFQMRTKAITALTSITAPASRAVVSTTM
jgi:hypothetical protein